MSPSLPHVATWIIAAFVILGILLRPRGWPEAVWAVLGAVLLMVFSLISLSDAGAAIQKGTDVYFFLIGMMLLAELARHEGLFDWLASHAVQKAKGSAARLFLLVYVVGTIVTIFLSNDATAVVLTPAVYAAASRAKAKPLPYLYVCAFIANAASFVLPISNPANLVVFGEHMPGLGSWVLQFGVASLLSIGVTFVILRFAQRKELTGTVERGIEIPRLAAGGRLAAAGIAATAALLLVASSLGWQLGLPTFLAGIGTTIAILIRNKMPPAIILREISWSVLPLVAALFILVRAVEGTGVLTALIHVLPGRAAQDTQAVAWLLGSAVAILSNVANNLPLGLVAGTVAQGAHLSPQVTGALLIGVDLGPNLSVTGSLATILWLVALRREGQQVSAWQFLGLGALVMPPALIAALAGVIWLPLP